MKALVTGGAGFVGRHLIPMLRDDGIEPIVVDPKLSTKLPGFSCTFEEWLDSGEDLDFIAAEGAFDIVIHLAANIEDVSKRINNGSGGLKVFQDLELDWRMMKWIEKFPPTKAFIYMSSCAVDNLEDPYAFVKLSGERLCGVLWGCGVPVVILRPFSGYAADQALSYPFPAILNRILGLERPVEIWGNGEQVRDWIHVDDIAGAIMWAIEEAPRGCQVDIGTGFGLSMIKMAELIGKLAFPGEEIKLKYDLGKPASSMRRVANTAFASLYGYKAKIHVVDGVRGAIDEWYLARDAERRSSS